MDQNAHDTLITQIFELFDTGEDAIFFLNENDLDKNQYLLPDLKTLCESIASAIEQLMPQITLKNKLQEIGMNAPPTVERIHKMLESGDNEGALVQFFCSFVPLFLFWRRYAEFFLIHAVSDQALKDWYAQEGERIRHDLSVIVLFYGNQKITKECLDSIERYTKGRSYELITFDNGSDPETTAWCESLPHTKKIYYPHNMGSSAAGNLIFTMSPYYSEGKYVRQQRRDCYAALR